MNVLVENAASQPPTMIDCKAWRDTYALTNVIALYDPDGVTKGLFDAGSSALSVFIDKDRVIRSKIIHTDDVTAIKAGIDGALAPDRRASSAGRRRLTKRGVGRPWRHARGARRGARATDTAAGPSRRARKAVARCSRASTRRARCASCGPRSRARAPRAVCLVTFGGGLVDGDAIEVDLRVEAGATLVVFTQATTKAFRGSSTQHIRAEVHGTLVLLPDPVACFARARYRQRVDITLHGEGSAVTLDGFTSGRAAFGERWAFDAVDLRDDRRATEGPARPRPRRASARRADGPIATRAGSLRGVRDACSPSAARRRGRHAALARRRASSPTTSSRRRAPARARLHSGAIVRIAGTSPAHALGEARRRLRNLPDIDVVDPFASRH